MKLETWFSTPVWYDFLNIDIESMKAYCLELETQSAGQHKSNQGGWHSDDLILDDHPPFHTLKSELIRSLHDVSKEIHPNFQVEISNIWIIINRGNAYNSSHFHPQSALSGVIYISSNEKSGNLNFFRDGLKEHYPIKTWDSPLFIDDVFYKPEPAKLIIFPSWIRHSVDGSDDQMPRISIAFNTNQINLNK